MQAQQPSWFRGFGAAGWIKCQCQISDINQQPPPLSAAAAMPFYSPPTPPPTYLLSFLSTSFYLLFFCSRARSQTDRVGFVMNGVLLHIRRKRPLRRGFTNGLHCPGNGSLDAAVGGSRPGRQKEPQHSEELADQHADANIGARRPPGGDSEQGGRRQSVTRLISIK